jgi:UDP-N-acetylglucosamine 2-epimerase (non-hydrolysing)
MAGSRSTSVPVPLRLVTTQDASTLPDGAPPRAVFAIGGRADAVRLTPVIGALEATGTFRPAVVLTGPPAEQALVTDIGRELGLPDAEAALDIRPGPEADLTAQTLTAFDAQLMRLRPELVVLAGDANATLSCALAAAKQQIAVAHVGSGLRSWDWSTPEEINRVVIDRLSDTLFTHSNEAVDNLVGEGVPAGRVHAVGSTVIDALRGTEPAARTRGAWRARDLAEGEYLVVMFHGREAVQDPLRLDGIVTALGELAAAAPVLFCVHPRVRPALIAHGALDMLTASGVRCVEPMGYGDFLSLLVGSGGVITDSATVQEETSALGVPCHTLAPVSERPITLTHGTNVLLGSDPAALASVQPSGVPHVACAIPLWDGHAAERVAEALVTNYAVQASGSSLSWR